MSLTKLSGVGVQTTTNVTVGLITATNFLTPDGSTFGRPPLFVVGMRTGAATTFNTTGSTFNVINRAGVGISISI